MIAKVSTGDPLRIPASAYNAFVDAAEAYQAQSRQLQVDQNGVPLPPGVALVRNQSGADQERFAILGLDAPLITPDDNLSRFHAHLTFAGVSPDADHHAHRFCILQEPIAAGAVGRAMVSGITPVQLDVQTVDDELAAVVTDETSSLKTGSEGGTRILWKGDGTGVQWGLIAFPAGGAGSGSPNLVLAVTAPNHGWMLGDVLHWNGSAWILADAAVVGATDLLGVVGKIPDDNSALVVLWGILCLDGLQDHTDYWLDPTVPGGVTETKPDVDHARLVYHHAENRLCVIRAGGAGGGGGGAERFADLTDVDVTSTPPEEKQAPVWNATAQRWKAHDVVLADPMPAHAVLAGPASGADAQPTFRDLTAADLAAQPATSVVANASGAAARPTAVAADTDGTVFLRLAGTLTWAQVPTAAIVDRAVTSDKLAGGSVSEEKLQRNAVSTLTIIDGAVTDPKIADGAVTDPKIASLSWAKLTGVPATFPPSYHEHPLAGDVGGWTNATVIQPGAVSTAKLADAAVTAAKIADAAVGNAEIADGAVSTSKIAAGAVVTVSIADGSVTDPKIVSVSWAKITGAPTNTLGGDLTGTLDNAQIAAGAVDTTALADGAVTSAKLATDWLQFGTAKYHLGDTVTGVMVNPMTGVGDMIVGGTGGTPTRLPANQGGTLQILTSKNNITSLISHILDALEDVTIASPTDKQVLTYDAASSQWKNTTPGPAAKNICLVGKITGKVSGNLYNLTLYPEYPSLAVAWISTATQVQGDTTKTIPANTWTLVCGNRKSTATGYGVADYDFFIQVPIWM